MEVAPPPGYPHEFESDVVLSDGGPVHVRPIRPDDRQRLAEFHSRLSAQTVYYRYFSPRPRLSEAELDRFTTVDYHDRMALVALLGHDIVGVARYDRYPGRPEAEVAFTVDDAHQGRGIGTVLLEHLAEAARRSGLTRFSAEVLPDNRKMLGVFRRAGFGAVARLDSGVVDVGFDLDPTPEALEAMWERERRADARSMARLLHPRSIAVIGASATPGTVGHEIVRNLVAHGFAGPVYPVNPTATHVASMRAWPSVIEVPDEVDMAVIAVPASVVPDVAAECARKRVHSLVVVSTGFSEGSAAGSGAERELVAFARGNGMRLLGPATTGLISTVAGVTMHASFVGTSPLPGRVALSTQSGPLGLAILEQATRAGLGISTFVNVGNRADVSGNDLLQYWEDDPDTDVVLLHVANFGNPRKFTRLTRRIARTKPVVAVAGAREDPSVDALFLQCGVIRVNTTTELFDAGRLLESQPLPAGRHLALVTNAVGPLHLALDEARHAGLEVAPLEVDTRLELRHVVPPGGRADNPVHLTHAAVPADYAAALEVVLDDPGVDAVLVVHAPPIAGDTADVVDVITRAAGRHPHKPVVASVLGVGDARLAPTAGTARAVPGFTFPEAAVAALGRAAGLAAWRARPDGDGAAPAGVDLAAARRIVAYALEVRGGSTLLPFDHCASLLACAGVPVAPARMVTTEDAAVAAADAIGYPVILKAEGMGRLRRSEAGGVALDLQAPEEVRTTYARMRAHLGKGMAEAMVQCMVEPGVETIVEAAHHRTFGPVVRFGLGGAFADVIDDRALHVAPLGWADAADLVDRSRVAGLLHEGPFAVDALCDLLVRVGWLAEEIPELAEVRLNPVLVTRQRAVAVDVHVRVAPAQHANEVRRLT